MPKAKKKPPRQKLVKTLDTQSSKICRIKAKVCQKCLKAPESQAAHIFSRWKMSTRWEQDNLIAMCFYCHIFWSHREPAEFTLWVQERMGMEKFNDLRKRAETIKQWSVPE